MYKINKIIITMVLLFLILVGCTTSGKENNQDTIQNNQNELEIIPKYSPYSIQLDYILTDPHYDEIELFNHMAEFGNLSIGMFTYDQYRSIYPTYNGYNQTYFETHGLILYRGYERDYDINYPNYHEIVSLSYYQENIHLHVQHVIQSEFVLHQHGLYFPKMFIYLLEFEKPKQQLEDVILTITDKKINETYYLNNQEDLVQLKNRLYQHNYVDAQIIIDLDYNEYLNKGKEAYVLGTIDKYKLLDDLHGRLTIQDKSIIIYYDKLSIDINELEKLITLSEKPEFTYVKVILKNYL